MMPSRAIKANVVVFTAIALLVVIGSLFALPQSAEAGRNPSLKIKSVKMNITPTADATMDNKKVDISFRWRATKNATGYQIDRRERIGDLSGSLSFESEWTGWKANRQESDTARSTTINYTYSFDQVGKMVEWRVRVKDANGKWSRWYNIGVSWGLKSKHSTHYVIKRAWFYPEDYPVLN